MPEVTESAEREDPIARFRSDVTVELVKATASDSDVLFAALFLLAALSVALRAAIDLLTKNLTPWAPETST